MNELDAWVAAACAELGLQPDDVKAGAVLDVARDVAHQVLRPGAPVSAYLMGVAVGRGADPSDVADRLSALALGWPTRKAAAESLAALAGNGHGADTRVAPGGDDRNAESRRPGPGAESLAALAGNGHDADTRVAPGREGGDAETRVAPGREGGDAETRGAPGGEGRDGGRLAPARGSGGRSGHGDGADPPIP